MTKSIYIKLRDGEKESELTLESLDKEHQLSLVDGMFKFFDIDVDFKELADIYRRSGKAYKEFYEHMDSEEHSKDEKRKLNAEEYAENLKKNTSHQEQDRVDEEKESEADYFVTGIKHDNLNRPLYKCRYKCTCGKEANHYIKIGTTTIRCWQCSKTMKVRPATTAGEVDKGRDPESYRDVNGNFYKAGEL